MTDDAPDEPQSFTSFLDLVKRLEKIVEETPDTAKQKIVDDEIKITEPQDELETISKKKESELEDVQKQAQDLEKHTVDIEKEEKTKSKKKKIQSILTIEEELIKYYSDADVQISDFYYLFKELSEDKIINVVKTKFHSLEKVKVEKSKILGVPFALCKINGKYDAFLQLEIDGINLPFSIGGDLKHLKLLSARADDNTNLTLEEIKIWNQAFNKFQLKLVQLLNEKAKDNLVKQQTTEYELLELDHTIIQEVIGEYEKKIKD